MFWAVANVSIESIDFNKSDGQMYKGPAWHRIASMGWTARMGKSPNIEDQSTCLNPSSSSSQGAMMAAYLYFRVCNSRQ